MAGTTFSGPELNGSEQEKNIQWWDENPMTYDWNKTLEVEEGTKEFFEAIDRRFFEAVKNFAHPGYPQQFPFSQLIEFDDLKDKKVLEVGCGAGGTAALFSLKGAKITAIDISERAVQLTRKRFSLYGLGGDVLLGDAENVKFGDGEFDLVWAWGVIHHTAQTQRAVNEIYRVLKPGGEAKVMVYHKNSFRYWVLGGLYYGVVKGKLLRMSLDEVNKSFTDGYIARHFTKRDVVRAFSSFRKVRVSVMDQGGNFIPFTKLNNFMAGIVSPDIWRRFNLYLMKRFGWFLFIEAEK